MVVTWFPDVLAAEHPMEFYDATPAPARTLQDYLASPSRFRGEFPSAVALYADLPDAKISSKFFRVPPVFPRFDPNQSQRQVDDVRAGITRKADYLLATQPVRVGLVDAALDYQERFNWSVIAANSGKKPLWRERFKHHGGDKGRFDALFPAMFRLDTRESRKLTGFGVMTGPLNEMLGGADFDDDGVACEVLRRLGDRAADFAVACTARGLHLWARFSSEARRSLHFGHDAVGELICRQNNYLVAPPSFTQTAPGSLTYYQRAWLVPPTPAWWKDAKPIDPSVFDDLLGTPKAYSVPPIASNPLPENKLPAKTARQPIGPPNTPDPLSCLPPRHGTRNACLWNLARLLKTADWTADAEEHRRAFLDWHHHCVRNGLVRTTNAGHNWSEFKRAYKSVNRPCNFRAATDALGDRLVPFLKGRHPELSDAQVLTLSQAAALALTTGNRFFLSVRWASSRLDATSSRTGWRHLRSLEDEGLLRCTRRGVPLDPARQATDYELDATLRQEASAYLNQHPTLDATPTSPSYPTPVGTLPQHDMCFTPPRREDFDDSDEFPEPDVPQKPHPPPNPDAAGWFARKLHGL